MPSLPIWPEFCSRNSHPGDEPGSSYMNLIDIRQLRAFQLLAETGSFTLAAKRMFLTQSAISHSTKALIEHI